MLCELVPEDIREPYDPYSDPYYNQQQQQQQPNYGQQQQPNYGQPQNYGQPNPVYNDDGYPTYPGSNARGRRGFNY